MYDVQSSYVEKNQGKKSTLHIIPYGNLLTLPHNLHFYNINTFKYHVFAPMGRFQLESFVPINFHCIISVVNVVL